MGFEWQKAITMQCSVKMGIWLGIFGLFLRFKKLEYEIHIAICNVIEQLLEMRLKTMTFT